MSANLERVAAFMRDLAEIAARVVQEELGLPQERAVELGLRISRDACDEHRGELIYVPAGLALHLDERDQAMYEAYIAWSRDITAVARQFKVSVQTAYKRIRLYEAAAYARRQGALFDDDGGDAGRKE